MKFTNVRFRDLDILCVDLDGQRYVAMRYAVERLGIDWSCQHRKLKSDPNRFRTIGVRLRMPHHRQSRVHVLMPMDRWWAWLLTIHPSRVSPSLRAALVEYQREADLVLYRARFEVLDRSVAHPESVRPASLLAILRAWARRLADVMTAPPSTPPAGRRPRQRIAP